MPKAPLDGPAADHSGYFLADRPLHLMPPWYQTEFLGYLIDDQREPP